VDRVGYDGPQELAKFHRDNPQDWVGVAHNRALDAYFAKLAHGDVSRDVCHDLVSFMSEDARSPESAHTTRAQRRTAGQRAFARAGFCLDRFAAASASESAMLVQATAVSPATDSILTRINLATQAATSSADLAYRINQMAPEIWALPGAEASDTWAVASVAVNSSQYWEANQTSVNANVATAYAPCIQYQPTSPQTAASACMGLTVRAPITRTLFRGSDGRSIFHLAQTYYYVPDPNCLEFFSARELVGADFTGAIAGGFMGMTVGALGGPAYPISGPASAAAGFVAGAGVTSGGDALWQAAQERWCHYFGGAPTKKLI
jgi:hypothetical protein